MTPETESNLRTSAMVMGAVSTALAEFSGSLIAHARGGSSLDDDAISVLISDAIRDMKNSELRGATIEYEAAFHRQAIEVFEHFAKHAVAKGATRK